MAKSDSVPHIVQQALNQREMDYLCPIGAFSQYGIRRVADSHEDTDVRQSFSIDGDRILHSLAYTRYIEQ